MKKQKPNTKSRIKTADQAKEFITRKICKVLNECLNQDIDDGFTCEIILYLAGQILLSNGDTDVFGYTISQLIENNQELFDTNDFNPDEGGTFH